MFFKYMLVHRFFIIIKSFRLDLGLIFQFELVSLLYEVHEIQYFSNLKTKNSDSVMESACESVVFRSITKY